MTSLPVNVPVQSAIHCLEMHTTGEPTRITYAGYPKLAGTLLEQRAEAKAKHDHIRRRLNWEPRGHFDMYGAILRPDTELTTTGQAHIGVLFTTNEGYSTMCGHATIALGRMLVDADERIFPRRSELRYNSEDQTTSVNLHAPCGLVEITVPAIDAGRRSDPSRPVSFLSVPSFATGISIKIPIPSDLQWPELRDREFVLADFSYGGAFYCLVAAKELGFLGRLNQVDLSAMNIATKNLKAACNGNPDLHSLFEHPLEKDLSFLYSVMVVGKSRAACANAHAVSANRFDLVHTA
jgi:trans-L-3-hydroxyproline dehydratase